MKKEEFMLGDWVMLNSDLKEYYPFAGKPCMVIGLKDDDGAIKIEYENNKYFWTDAEEDVIPIPLTPEILEKNGFQYNNLPFVQGWEQFGLTLYSGGNGYRINCGTNVALVIDSVHELQHALKLCGIEKEIVP